MQVTELQPQMALIGKSFKKDAKEINRILKELDDDNIALVEKELEGKGYVNFLFITFYNLYIFSNNYY